MKARSRFVSGAALALTLLAGGAGALRAQQPATPARGAQQPLDPQAAILQRLKRLDAKPDTVKRDSTGAQDSTAVEVTPPPNPGAQGSAGVRIDEDSIMKALYVLRGYTATEYTGKTARFAADTGRLVLTGPAQVLQGTQAMTADSSLVYNQKTQIACGFGKPKLSGAGQSEPVESDQVCYNVEQRVGVAFGARTKFQEGASAWFVNGQKLYLSGNENAFSRNAGFTDCDLTQPHYQFVAREMKVVRGKVIVARDVTLKFADVPVFWLPFMLQPVEKGRSSGLLMPRFDLNDVARTNTNYQRRIQNVGFYWAMNDHLGSLLSMDWFSNNYTAVHGAFDYSFKRQFLDGGLEARRYWRVNGGKEFTLSTRNGWRPDERTSIQLNGSYASSSAFVRAQSFDPRELNRSIESNLAMQRRFNWGSFDLSGRRQQYLQNDRVSMTLPSVSFSPMPVSFFKRADGSSLITWNGSGNYTASRVDGTNYVLAPDPSTRSSNGALSSSFNVGKISWSQSVAFNDDRSLLRPEFQRPVAGNTDSLQTVAAIAAQARRQMTWSTSLSYQQRLFGTSSVTPHLSINGQSVSVDTGTVHTGMVAGPRRMDFGASTQVDVYGFWPGVGPFRSIRHKLSPSFSYSYSPAVDPSSLTPQQVLVFGRDSTRERSLLSIGLSQTWEAKYKETEKRDSAATQDTTTSLDGEPRRPPQARKITLLALSGWAGIYDFTNDPRTGRRIGFQAPTISTSVRSDLVPGLQFNLTHDLFRYDGDVALGTARPRHFSPYLTNASTSFNLDDKSWIFRILGLASRAAGRAGDNAQQQVPDSLQRQPTAAEQANLGLGQGIVPGVRGRSTDTGARGAVGSWSSSFTYDLSRQRPSGLPNDNSVYGGCSPIFGNCSGLSGTTQMLRGNFNFQPTPNWRVTWQTGYSFSDSRFADHVLTFSRDLHDWEAHFDFVRAQNGNFSFQFRVNLKAQPDLKFDYSQRGGDAFQQFNSF